MEEESGEIFFRSDPHRVGNGDLVGFWQNLGPGHLEKFRTWAENRKTQFPDARGPKTRKKITALSGMVVNNFLVAYLLTNWTPTGGKTRNTRFFGHFGLGRLLAANGKSQFPGARGPEMKKKKKTYTLSRKGRPQIFGN